MNSRVTVCLARLKKCHKCKFVPRLLSMIAVSHDKDSVKWLMIFFIHAIFLADMMYRRILKGKHKKQQSTLMIFIMSALAGSLGSR